MDYIKMVVNWVVKFFKEHLGSISANTLGWVTIVLLHMASVPTLLAVLVDKSDLLPPVDIMVFVWGGLVTLFFKSLIDKNSLYIATNAMGFAAQTTLMGLILFK